MSTPSAPHLPVTIDSQQQFNQTVASHDFIVVLFTAKWCAPCQTFYPNFAEVAAQAPQALFAVADIDVATDLASNFQVAQVPALMVIRQRVVIDMVTGAMHPHELQHHLAMWQALDMTAIDAHFTQTSASA
ncbi:thioredoxin family protein [Methylophilus sp. 14]|uniref:thioredoxin family protein n=1 Tax=Methylophilus sp. 14 TaxID=2781019 RepID=UPI001890B41E|nr:thioredoxin family protein [Methylophilus sp. 14]MBF4989252.1 thioredoxin family protein [Methylophilus sp. 14]